MKKGFTLAEVLITLGIIGILAALTMPSLNAYYQKHVTVTRLQKAYNSMSNTINIAISEEAFELDYTELLKIYNKNSKKIANLELWVLDYDLEEEINTEEKIKSKYSNKIKIVSKEEMAKAILDNKEGIAIFHNVYPKNYSDGNESWKMVIDNATGEILYLQNKISFSYS